MDASKKSINLNLLTKSEIEQFFNQFDVICSDCDGKLSKTLKTENFIAFFEAEK